MVGYDNEMRNKNRKYLSELNVPIPSMVLHQDNKREKALVVIN